MESLAAKLLGAHSARVRLDALASVCEETGVDTADAADVFEELLYRDIHEWGGQYLGKEVATLGTTAALKGKHLLQVVGVRDVTQPKIQTGGDEPEGDEFSMTKEASRFNRAGRLLKVKLSDGFSTITAVELATNPHIRETPMPGSKVLLDGIAYRGGLFVIKQDTFKPVGGSVDELEQEYNLKKALSARKGGLHGTGAPPFIPFGRHDVPEDLIPEKPEAGTHAIAEDDDEPKKRREVEVAAADYRRAMGPSKPQIAKHTDEAPGGKGGKGGKPGKDRICHDFEKGKCFRGASCKMVHTDASSKRWPGKQASSLASGAAEGGGDKAGKRVMFDEPVLAARGTVEVPVAKKEERKVEQPTLTSNFTQLKKEEDEVDMFGNKIKEKKQKDMKDVKPKEAPAASSSSLAVASLTNFSTGAPPSSAEPAPSGKKFPTVSSASTTAHDYGGGRYEYDLHSGGGHRGWDDDAGPSRSSGKGGGSGHSGSHGGKGGKGGKGGGGGKSSHSGGGKGGGGGGHSSHSSGGKGGKSGHSGHSGGGGGGGGGGNKGGNKGGGGGGGASSSGKGSKQSAPPPPPGVVPHNKGSGGGRGKAGAAPAPSSGGGGGGRGQSSGSGSGGKGTRGGGGGGGGGRGRGRSFD